MTAPASPRNPAREWAGRRVLLIGDVGASYEVLASQVAQWGASLVLAGEDAEFCSALADRLAARGDEVLSVPSGSSGPRTRRAALGLIRSLIGEIETVIFHVAPPWLGLRLAVDPAPHESALPTATTAGDPLERALEDSTQVLFDALAATMPDLQAAESARIFAWWQPIGRARAELPAALLEATVQAALMGLLRSVASEFPAQAEAGVHALAVAPERVADGLQQLALLGGPVGRSAEAQLHPFDALPAEAEQPS